VLIAGFAVSKWWNIRRPQGRLRDGLTNNTHTTIVPITVGLRW
jgi:hypothetical protein